MVLVTKDINLRLKAKSLNLVAEDFESGKIKDVDSLYSGRATVSGVSASIIDKVYQEGYRTPEEVGIKDPANNGYYIFKNGKSSALTYFNSNSKVMARVEKMSAFGIKPLNAEQVFALHALLNPEIKLVTIQGVAGTGKTLLALAGALEQKKDFRQIYLARTIVPLSNKILATCPGI